MHAATTSVFPSKTAALQHSQSDHYTTLLARYRGQHDIVVCTFSANRSRPELTTMIGFLINTLPIRLDLSTNPTFTQLLHHTHTAVVAAYAHQDLPFTRIIDTLHLP